MALTTIAGSIKIPTGAAPNSARLVFTLATWDMDGAVVYAPDPTIEPLTGAAYSVALESTTDKERQAAYRVELLWYSTLRRETLSETLGVIAVPPTGGPFDLPDLLAIPIVEPVPAEILALCQAYAVSAGASAAAAVSAAESVQPYADLAAAAAASPPLTVSRIAVNQNGGTVYYRRMIGGLALTTDDGAAWEYDGGYVCELLQVAVPVGRNLQSEVDRVACIDTRGDGFVALRLANAYQLTVPVVIKSTTRLTIEQVSGASVPLGAAFTLGADAITVDYGAYYKHGFLLDATNGRCRVALSVFGECEIVSQMGAFGLRTNTPVGPDANGVGMFVWKGGYAYCASPVDPVLGPLGPVFRGFPRVGIWTTYGARASVAGADCTDTGFSMDKADGCAAFFVSRAAVVQIDYSDCSGSHRGIRNGGAFIHANRLTGNNVNQLVWTFRGGRTSIQSGTFEDCGEAGWPILDVSGEGAAVRGAGEIFADANNFTGAKSDLASATTPGGLITINEVQVDDFHARLAVVGAGARVFATKLAAGVGGVGAVSSPNVANAALELIQVADGGEFNGVGVLAETGAAMTRKLRLSNFGKATLRNSTLDGAQPLVSITGSVTLELTNLDVGGTAYFANGARLSDGASFDTREEAVQAVGLGWRLPNGGTFTADGLPYRFDNGAGDPIADLPDVVPANLSTPEHFNASGSGAGDDTDFLNNLFAAGGSIKPPRNHTYRVTGAVTIPDGAFIDGELRLAYAGANDLAILTIGNDVLLDRLSIEVPTATGVTASIGTAYRGGEFRLSGAGGGGSAFLTIANPAGLDLDLFECSGGFQRPLVVGNDAAWSTGGRLGHVRIRDYTRGVRINYLDGFVLGSYDIAVRNSAASYTAGHNGILAAGLRNCTFGAGRIEGAGEHLFRLGGTAAMGASYNNMFGDLDVDGPGGCAIKINPDIIAYDFRFGDVTAIGRFMTAPGGNREGARLSHCRKFTFGRFSITPADGAVWACQDVFALNDATDVSVAHIHAEGVSQSVIDITAPQDVGSGLGAGDVRRITVGGLSGSSTTSKPILRIDAIDGDHVIALSDIHVSGVDYFTDGELVTAEALADVDGPITISGRLRKTDLTTVPTVNNMPATMRVDLTVGEMPVVAFNGALVDARAITQPYADRTAMIAALAATPAGVTRIGHYTTGGSVLFYRRSAGATVISDMAGWVYESGTLDQDLTVQVPGNYPSLQAAFNALSVLRSHGAVIAVNIQAGHQLAAGLLLQNGDFSHFRITSSYTPVTLAAGFVGVTLPGVVDQNVNTVITVSNARGPNIACVIDMGGVLGTGLFATLNSTVGVDPSCGIINAGYYGVSVSSTSTLNADNAVFYEAGWGNRVTTTSFASLRKANLHGGCTGDLEAACLVVSRGAQADVRGDPGDETNLSGSARNGLYVRRSGVVSADWCDCSNSGATGFLASNGGVIAANFAIASGSAIGFYCLYATMHAANSIATGCTDRAYGAYQGGWLNAYGANGSGSTGLYGARASDGGTIICADGNFTKAVSDTDDISVAGGGFINANGATGQLSITDNLPGANGFIMGGSTRQSPKTTDNITVAKATVSHTAPELLLSESDTTTLARLLLSGGNLNIQAQASGGASNTGVILLSGYNGADATRIEMRGPVKQPGVTFASLPAAATAGAGTRHIITDASVTTFQAVAAGGGSTLIPVYSDGTNWRVG